MEGKMDELTASNNLLRQSNFNLQEQCSKIQSDDKSKQALLASSKQKEFHLTTALKEERKISDLTKKSIQDHQKCENENFRLQQKINVLSGKLQEREQLDKHLYKILSYKRDLIEHEKLEFKKQFVKQSKTSNRSSSRSELLLE